MAGVRGRGAAGTAGRGRGRGKREHPSPSNPHGDAKVGLASPNAAKKGRGRGNCFQCGSDQHLIKQCAL